MLDDQILPTQRIRLGFNSDWLFCRGDGSEDSAALSYERLRDALLPTGNYLRGVGSAGRYPKGPEASAPTPHTALPNFDDSAFKRVTVPHDYGIEGPFSLELPGETGKLPWAGVAWYRKRFHVEHLHEHERLVLEIDGAMSFSSFWLNGKLVGGWPYGYTSFQIDLTDQLDPSGENVLAVRLDNPENSSRWYPGAGIYRNTWLVRHHAVHIAPSGAFIHAPRVSPHAAVVDVDVVIENDLDVDVEVTLETSLFERDPNTGEPRGDGIVLERRMCPVPARGFTQQTVCTTLQTPKLWSLEERNRYVACTRLLLDGIEVDQVRTTFGIRTAQFDSERGFLLNGEPVRLQGVCMHHDLGALGTALSVRALERQLEILTEMGVNSIRTSHNPPAPELLELCDERGILLMVEAFDCWERGKKTPEGITEGHPEFRYFDYATVFADWYEPDLRGMVRRARNHPSVIVYSIGNEVIEQWYPDGYRWATALAGIVREEDRSRAVTAGCNGEIAAYRGFQTAIDVMGFNYKPDAYSRLKERNPTLCMVATETASTISTRGEYFYPVLNDPNHGRVDFQVSSYDLCTPPWAFTPDAEFIGLDEAPYVAGEYVWTGFDYLGEPTPYNSDVTNLLNYSSTTEREKHRLELEQLGKIRVPSRSSYFGIVDLAGFPKDRFYLYQSRWRPELPMAHILPHWNWPERIGQITPVHVYGSGDEAELFLNGCSLGTRKRALGQYRFRWDDVTYEPGRLEVRTKKDGKPWATAVCETTGEPVGLRLEADRATLVADGCDLAFVTISVVDRANRVVPRTNPLVRCHVEGAGEFVAMDNGDPTSLVSFASKERAAHQGLLLAILRTTKTAGEIRITVCAEGLAPSALSLMSR